MIKLAPRNRIFKVGDTVHMFDEIFCKIRSGKILSIKDNGKDETICVESVGVVSISSCSKNRGYVRRCGLDWIESEITRLADVASRL